MRGGLRVRETNTPGPQRSWAGFWQRLNIARLLAKGCAVAKPKLHLNSICAALPANDSRNARGLTRTLAVAIAIAIAVDVDVDVAVALAGAGAGAVA